jgi:hypothetical protein
MTEAFPIEKSIAIREDQALLFSELINTALPILQQPERPAGLQNYRPEQRSVCWEWPSERLYREANDGLIPRSVLTPALMPTKNDRLTGISHVVLDLFQRARGQEQEGETAKTFFPVDARPAATPTRFVQRYLPRPIGR